MRAAASHFRQTRLKGASSPRQCTYTAKQIPSWCISRRAPMISYVPNIPATLYPDPTVHVANAPLSSTRAGPAGIRVSSYIRRTRDSPRAGDLNVKRASLLRDPLLIISARFFAEPLKTSTAGETETMFRRLHGHVEVIMR